MVVLQGFRKRGNGLKQVDLGELDGPLLIFGGVHSNLQAFQALINVAKQLGIPPKNMICTGDVVAYCADAEGSVNAIRDAGCVVLIGNVEQQLAAKADDCGCGFKAGTMCDYLSARWYKHANETISDESRAWMFDLPERIWFTHSGKTYVVLHGGASEIAKFIWSVDDNSIFEAEFEAVDADIILAGHSGIPFKKAVGDKFWINAGAIGMPPHDGGQETRYVIISDGKSEIHKLGYDNYGASAQMQVAGLNNGYDTSLISGYWPSEDVLPKALRR